MPRGISSFGVFLLSVGKAPKLIDARRWRFPERLTILPRLLVGSERPRTLDQRLSKPSAKPDPESPLANHKATKKSARQDLRRRARNRSIRTSVRTLIKSVREATASGDASLQERLRQAERAIRRAASKGAIPKRQADRKVARLAKAAHRSVSS